MVFYLKYRPKTLSELDNTHVAEVIGKYLAKEPIPHAFLFTGPKGTGKTSTARILAKSINCQNKKNFQACGECEICRSIAKGNQLDVLEIDAASNRGIDEIRDLREKIKLAPTLLKYKVYIIDEVHMLTTEAFNALLKTLEEPPKHAVFILATTEAHKVPETVISRCVKIEFQKATISELMHALKRVITGEKLAIDEEALNLISEAADGSFRDATKLLEELALENIRITEKAVKLKTGSSDKKLQEDFLDHLHQKKAKEMLLVVAQLTREGKNLRQFFLEILKRLEDYLIALYTNDTPSQWTKNELTQAIGLFTNAFMELKTAVILQLPFELAIVEYAFAESKTIGNPLHTAIKPTSPNILAHPDKSVQVLIDKWPEVLAKLKPLNHSIAGVLRSCRPLKIQDNVLVLEAAYKFHADRLNELPVMELVAKTLSDVLGLKITIKTVIKQRG